MKIRNEDKEDVLKKVRKAIHMTNDLISTLEVINSLADKERVECIKTLDEVKEFGGVAERKARDLYVLLIYLENVLEGLLGG